MSKYLSTQYAVSAHLDARLSFHERFRTNPVHLWDWVWDFYGFTAHHKVLEVGCGTGAIWKHNESKVPDKMQIDLVDSSLGMLEKCKAQFAFHKNKELHCHSLESLPFKDKEFDRLLCHFMMYHVQDKDQACLELKRVAKSGAILGILTNSINHMREIDDLALKLHPGYPQSSNRGARSFCEENAEELLDRNFSNYEKQIYEDSVNVDDSFALTAYLRSMVPDQEGLLGEDFFTSYRLQADKIIQSEGAFKIKKRSVLYKIRL